MEQDNLPSTLSSDTTEIDYYSTEEIKEAARYDLDIFAAILIPTVAVSAFPPIYIELWGRLISGAEDLTSLIRIVYALPRGHAKTTFIRLYICWLIIYSEKKFIIVFSATQRLTRATISTVANILSKQGCIQIYGDWRENATTDNQDLKKFKFNGKTKILAGFGAEAAVRGQNEDEYRPDVIIFDDAQTKECAESQTESENFHAWFFSTALKLRDSAGCVIVYIGNMYRDILLNGKKSVFCCVLRNLVRHPQWFAVCIGAFRTDGSVLWEEVRSKASLLEELQHDIEVEQEDVFMAEVQNDPKGKLNLSVNVAAIQPVQLDSTDHLLGSFLVLDPATSKLTPDQVCIIYFEVYDIAPVARKIITCKDSSFNLSFRILQLATELNCPIIFIESQAYQYELCTLINDIAATINFEGLEVVDIYNSKNKNQRIIKFLHAWSHGEILTCAETHTQVQHQGLNFDISKTDNLDDILDCMEMGKRIWAEYKEQILSCYIVQKDPTIHKRASPLELLQSVQHTSF